MTAEIPERERALKIGASAGTAEGGPSVAEVIDHVLRKHHAFLRREIPRIRGMLKACMAQHPDEGEVLDALSSFFNGLAEDIMEHMEKEEVELFPLVLEGQDAQDLEPVLQELDAEHELAGEKLTLSQFPVVRALLPTAAGEQLHSALMAFEADLGAHIDLERDVLFPGIRGALKGDENVL